MAEKCKGCTKINLLPIALREDFKSRSSCMLCIVHVQILEAEITRLEEVKAGAEND